MELIEPGGIVNPMVHVWTFRGKTVARVTPGEVRDEDGRSTLLRSFFPQGSLPGIRWGCGPAACRPRTGSWSA